MSDLFTDDWMKSFMDEWNDEPELSDALAKIAFKSTIGYGFHEDDAPRGVLVVEGGKATAAGSYDDQELNWDIRASETQWDKWISKPPGMMGLGAAFTTGKMKFVEGDYGAMIKDPRMAKPFIKSFTVMSRA
jgi:putative sterol carrier protein